jgi:hypothetical protein
MRGLFPEVWVAIELFDRALFARVWESIKQAEPGVESPYEGIIQWYKPVPLVRLSSPGFRTIAYVSLMEPIG